jgi:ribonuclease Z
MLPDRLAAAGVHGPDVRTVAERGWVEVAGRRVERAGVSAPRPGSGSPS